MSEIHLHESKHPSREARQRFEALVGIDEHKQQLVDELALLLDRSRLDDWRDRHHPKGLPILDELGRGAPVILLSGEVGCGKTALASAVATPVADALDARVMCLETPSNIRGSGLVGEISHRVTAVFDMARSKLRAGGTRYGILVIDEADDLATSRAQLQAHHEDRAGLNVLVKQIDLLAREAPGLAVLLITNRISVLDPAIRRRVALHLTFERPDDAARRALFASMLRGTNPSDTELDRLVRASARKGAPFSSSDLVHRVARHALAEARRTDAPFNAKLVLQALDKVSPSPLVDDRPVQ